MLIQRGFTKNSESNYPQLALELKENLFMNMVKKNWSDISTTTISEETIRALHSPQENYKIYANTYEAGKRFPTNAGHAFVLYILAGSCKATINGSEITLSASEFMPMEKGSYTFDIVGSEELKLVKVFSL